MRVHVIQTGRLVGNETVMRGEGWSSVFRRRKRHEFPVLLTAAGRRAAGQVSRARAAVLDDALRDLSDEEKELLDGLLARAWSG
jgi:hypothetical protein